MAKMYYFGLAASVLIILLSIPTDSSAEQDQVTPGVPSESVTTNTVEDNEQGLAAGSQDDVSVVKLDDKTAGLKENLVPILREVGGKLFKAAVNNIGSGAEAGVGPKISAVFVPFLTIAWSAALCSLLGLLFY